MKDEQELYDYIDEYLKSGGRPHELTDADLALEVGHQKLVKDVVQLQRLSAVSLALKEVDAKAKLKSKAIKVTALVLLIAALGYVAMLVLQKREQNNAVLAPIPQPVAEETKRPDKVLHTAPKTALIQAPQQSRQAMAPDTVAYTPSVNTALTPDTLTASPPKPLAATSRSESTVTAAAPICNSVLLVADFTYDNPCKGTTQGSIHFESAQGGRAPYKYSIDGGQTYQSSPYFAQLHAGRYALKIKDAEDCISELLSSPVLTETSCESASTLAWSFNPHKETLEIPNTRGKAGIASLYDREGNLIYKTSFGNFEAILWNGHSSHGGLAVPGVYILQLHYEDNEKENGAVTLVY